jgi:hypothetical protein
MRRTIGIVCGGASPIRIPLDLEKLGCASPGTLRVWIEPLDPSAAPAARCGPVDLAYAKVEPTPPLGEASAPVFGDKTGSGCDGGEERDLRLDLE